MDLEEIDQEPNRAPLVMLRTYLFFLYDSVFVAQVVVVCAAPYYYYLSGACLLVAPLHPHSHGNIDKTTSPFVVLF